MPDDNVEVAKLAFQAFRERDVDRLLALADDAIELDLPSTATFAKRAGTYSGSEGVRAYFDDVSELWEELVLMPLEFSAVGRSHVLVRGRVRARRPGGETTEVPSEWIFRFRDGRLARACAYSTKEEALEAVGAGQAGREQ